MPRKPASPLSLLCYSRGVTRLEIAAKLGLNPSHTGKIINGDTMLPAAYVAGISEALGVSPSEVLRCASYDLPRLVERSNMRREVMLRTGHKPSNGMRAKAARKRAAIAAE